MIIYDSIEIPLALHRAMAAHLEPAYPNEGCGIMVGDTEGTTLRLSRVVGAENLNKERGRDRFEIDPLFYLQTERSCGPGEKVIGFFHSHPDCPEIASETDRQFARGWPGFVWIIYRVEQGIATSVRAWLLDNDTERFDEITIRFVARDAGDA